MVISQMDVFLPFERMNLFINNIVDKEYAEEDIND